VESGRGGRLADPPSGQNRQKQSEGVRFFVISALLKYTLTDCFFGDFAHWALLEPIIGLYD